MGSKKFARFLDGLDGKAGPQEDPKGLIETHEGGRRSVPYRCRHAVVTPGGWYCMICDEEMDADWREAWAETSSQSPSRPQPRHETEAGPESESAGEV